MHAGRTRALHELTASPCNTDTFHRCVSRCFPYSLFVIQLQTCCSEAKRYRCNCLASVGPSKIPLAKGKSAAIKPMQMAELPLDTCTVRKGQRVLGSRKEHSHSTLTNLTLCSRAGSLTITCALVAHSPPEAAANPGNRGWITALNFSCLRLLQPPHHSTPVLQQLQETILLVWVISSGCPERLWNHLGDLQTLLEWSWAS